MTAVAAGLFAGTAAQAASVAVPVTEATFAFSGNDYVSNGRSYSYSVANGDALTLETERWPTDLTPHVSVGVRATNGDTWGIVLYGGSAPLAVGDYVDARRWPFNEPARPGLDLGGNGRGCNTSIGDFRVNRIRYDANGAVEALDAAFSHSCEGGVLLSKGRVVVNYPADPRPEPATAGSLTFAGNDQATAGSYAYRSASGDILLADARGEGNALLVGGATAGSRKAGGLGVAAPAGQPLRVGTYSNTGSYLYDDGAGPRLSFDGPDGFCTEEQGTFTIRQLQLAADGTIALLDLSFSRRCNRPGSIELEALPTTGRVLINVPNPPVPVTVAVTASSGELLRDKSRDRSPAFYVRAGGTLSCSVSGQVAITGTLTQPQGGGVVTGIFATSASCTAGAAVPWSAGAQSRSSNQTFALGAATLAVSVRLPDPEYLNYASAQASSTVQVVAGTVPITPRRPLP